LLLLLQPQAVAFDDTVATAVVAAAADFNLKIPFQVGTIWFKCVVVLSTRTKSMLHKLLLSLLLLLLPLLPPLLLLVLLLPSIFRLRGRRRLLQMQLRLSRRRRRQQQQQMC
jgi:hypothetical protein